MYAVVRSGGKQYRVAEGDQLEVERLEGAGVELTPLLVVDGNKVISTPADLAKFTVKADIVGEAKGKKINGFTYKRTTNQRRRYGHRQHYSVIEVRSIGAPKRTTKKAAATEPAEEKEAAK